MDKIKVLFLAANPAGTSPLGLDEEVREIEAKIRASEYRDALELITKWAVRPDDLLQALNQHKPHVVHFSGHGSPAEEIILLDHNRNPRPVGKEALVSLLRSLERDNVRVVVLNACYSRPQAEAIAQVIDCAVGMNKAIGDRAAITFAASFYRALGFGRSVQEAFAQGKVILQLEGIPEEKTPELLARPGVDLSGLVLIDPSATPAPPRLPEVGKQLDREALVSALCNLAPPDLSRLVTALAGAAINVSRVATVPEQVAELIRWAESPTGPGLEELRATATRVLPAFFGQARRGPRRDPGQGN
jgi:hypothetical protein